ncbi:MAG TPA: glycosyltransferase [Pyrinomonadaceae bacterium]|nr:glycosyltransferase [Pyrinomonadaceae bacterium]
MTKSLYICYFGMREPLVQTQVIPYLKELVKGGVSVSLLTFEPDLKKKWTSVEIEERRAELAAEGIDWHCLAYHKRPSVPATLYDIFAGAWKVRGMLKAEKFDILHCRVHVPMLMGALARKFSGRRPKLLFDIRGFFPEEFVDAGIWKQDSLVYRGVKQVEKWLMKEADGFVVLTETARQILFPESEQSCLDKHLRPIEVIPCCVDLDRFSLATAETRLKMRTELNLGDRFVLAYVGAFGGWYLTDEMADFYRVTKEKYKDAFALILTQSDPEMIRQKLNAAGYSDKDVFIRQVNSAEIPVYLSAADAALSFIKPSYSKKSSSPTKNAEYLACGVPIIANPGVGDVDEMIKENGVGVLIEEFTATAYGKALTDLEDLGSIGENCRDVARREFDLHEIGGSKYRHLYHRLGAALTER